MKKVALVIDNSGSMTPEEMEQIKVLKMIPISFIINGEEYFENKNMTYTEFYNYLTDKKTDVSTCQPSIEVIKEAWREILKEYDEIVYIILSSGLSESCNTSINASHEEEFEDRVFVVNNQRVAFMNKMPMYEARYMIDHGKSGCEIKEYLEKTKGECGAYIAVDTLKYLKKGGRVTPAAAAIGTLLNIKPILQVHGGKLDAFAKVMSMKQAKNKMIQATRKEIEERFPEEAKQGKVYIGMAHSMQDPNSPELKAFEAEVREQFSDMPFFTHDPLPLFIVCHTGPGAMAVGYCVDRMGVIADMMKK
ncbi:MAG: DegV family protein [Clostridiales bacterium]|nr:DegV family protein [Clostridiales bacterium]